MKKTLVAVAVLAAFVSQTVDARGGRGFSAGRSFSRPAAVKTQKAPAVKRSQPAPAAPAATSGAPKPTANPAAGSDSRRKDDDDSSGGGFWSSFFGAAAGVAVYDAVTDDSEKTSDGQKEEVPQ